MFTMLRNAFVVERGAGTTKDKADNKFLEKLLLV